uniref:Transmembrane protein n=1 Tax=Medicago truncatula TaxID=3880 RepID=A2Q135_MEDTR|nr:hypothetical protein MtrDRAFT_AC147481g34v2 [Medicago truncatula]
MSSPPPDIFVMSSVKVCIFCLLTVIIGVIVDPMVRFTYPPPTSSDPASPST